jgi:hypothetical protein
METLPGKDKVILIKPTEGDTMDRKSSPAAGACLVLLIVMLVTGNAYAEDVSGSTALGVGTYHFDVSDEFVPLLPGIDFRLWLTENVGLQGSLSYVALSAEADEEDPYDATETHLGLDGNLLIKASSGESVNLNLIIGMGLLLHSNMENRNGHNRSDFKLTFGFAPEVFIYPNLSLEVNAGLFLTFYGDTEKDTYDYLNDEYSNKYDDSHSAIMFGGTPALGFMGMGFHYYFK